MILGEGEYPTKCLFSRTENMEVVRLLGQLVLFFNLVQFGEIERAKPQFFYWQKTFGHDDKNTQKCCFHPVRSITSYGSLLA